jgi:hypothetical protein
VPELIVRAAQGDDRKRQADGDEQQIGEQRGGRERAEAAGEIHRADCAISGVKGNGERDSLLGLQEEGSDRLLAPVGMHEERIQPE